MLSLCQGAARHLTLRTIPRHQVPTQDRLVLIMKSFQRHDGNHYQHMKHHCPSGGKRSLIFFFLIRAIFQGINNFVSPQIVDRDNSVSEQCLTPIDSI